MLELEELPSKYWSGRGCGSDIRRFGRVFASVKSMKFIDAPQSTRVFKGIEPKSGICVFMRKDWEDWEAIGVLEKSREG
jgi:hypothetical protein